MKVLKASQFNPEDKGFLFHCSPLEATLLYTLVAHTPSSIFKLLQDGVPLGGSAIDQMYAAMKYGNVQRPNNHLFGLVMTGEGKIFNVKEFVNEVY